MDDDRIMKDEEWEAEVQRAMEIIRRSCHDRSQASNVSPWVL